MEEKIFQGHVILNWKNGSFRAVKRLSKTLKETEIPIEINIKVTLPEKPKMSVTGELELSGAKVKQLILDALDSGDFKDGK
jgi:hypothetical protein